jgi:hypothetical protein
MDDDILNLAIEWCARCKASATFEMFQQESGWKRRNGGVTLYCPECVDIVDTEEIVDG